MNIFFSDFNFFSSKINIMGMTDRWADKQKINKLMGGGE